MRGAVVAIDPRNGDVLALVSTPAFDPNRFAEGLSRHDFVALNTDPDRPLFNRALAGTYPPGSTVKPFIALAALEHETIAPEKELYCPGEYRLPGQTHKYREGRGGVHGNVNLHEAIVRSCDVYFYQLAIDVGIDDLSAGLKRFGFGASTGLDINGEQTGVIPSAEWKKEAVPAPRRPDLVPGRHDQRGRRPGLRARDAGAARTARAPQWPRAGIDLRRGC